jgi:hypothetical protein
MPVYSSDGICINFEIPMKNFIKEHNKGLFSERKLTSVLLWIYLRTTTTTSQKLRLQIQNVNQTKSKNSIINIKYLNDGWNTINITNIFRLPHLNLNSDINNSFNVSLLLKCSKGCSIGYSNYDLFSFDDNINNDIIIDNYSSRKPILSVNVNDEDFTPNSRKTRSKRKANHHIKNYKAHGIDKDNYNPKLCLNNYPDPDRECCLITYYVNFNTLKWSSWIISPTGFVANYCAGKCNELPSIKIKFSLN